jgi:hypothetical protein
MQDNKKSKIIKWILRVVAVVMFLALIIPIPINKEYDAIEIKLDDPSYLVKRKINIKGKYYWNILTSDMFEGRITVSDYDFTETKKMDNIYIPYDNGCLIEYTETIKYGPNSRDVRKYFYPLGRLFSKPWFRNMAMIIYEQNIPYKDKSNNIKQQGGWGTADGYCIVASAKTYKEAIKILVKQKVIPADFLNDN